MKEDRKDKAIGMWNHRTKLARLRGENETQPLGSKEEIKNEIGKPEKEK